MPIKNDKIVDFLAKVGNCGPENAYFVDGGSYHFYDWWCSGKSLQGKAMRLVKKLKRIVDSPKIDGEKQYVFFKNNCPMNGRLYDDFRICDIKTGAVVYTIVPKSGHESANGLGEVWGKENDFKEAIMTGTWSEIVAWFKDAEPKISETKRSVPKKNVIPKFTPEVKTDMIDVYQEFGIELHNVPTRMSSQLNAMVNALIEARNE